MTKDSKETPKIDLEVADVSFTFAMTRNEANEILKHPKGKIVRQYMKYLKAVLISAARKYKEIPIGEIIAKCKVPVEES